MQANLHWPVSNNDFNLIPMRNFSVYLLYRSGSALVRAMPLWAVFRLGQCAGLCAWLVLPKYRRLALGNAAIAFAGEKSPRELRQMVRRHFQLLGANLLSSIKIAALPVDQLQRPLTIHNIDLLHRHLRSGRPVVVILSHLGNWELFAQVLPKFIGYVRNATIYQPLANPLIDQHVRALRARTGVEMFDRKEGFQEAIKLLRSGGVIGILSDQHAGDQGLWVPFFGKLASTSSLPALLAKRTGAILMGAAVYTAGTGRWRMGIGPEIETKEEPVESLTAKVNELIATQIRDAPEDWFWVHDRWKTPRPNFLLRRYRRGVYLPPAMSPEELKPFRILIRTSNWLGDAVMSVPAVRAIKQGRPDALVSILTPEKLASMWKLLPEVDEVIPIPRKSLAAAVRAIRKRSPFDVALLFPNSLRVALETWLGGVPRRVGYRGHCRLWLLNQLVRRRGKPGPFEHQSIHYLRIAQELGAAVEEGPKEKRATPDLQHPTFDIRLREPAQPSSASSRQLKLGLCPGAEYGKAKCWPVERFAETALAIAADRPVEWILFGTPKDAQLGNDISRALGEKCVNRIGQTTLDQLIDELRTCRLLLTNDTGTMHLAALLGVPTVAIFGSTEPGLTGPLGNGNIILRHQVECSPCFLRECPIDFRCMKAVTVRETVDAVLSILGQDHR